jgi:hypothetical protein
MTEGIYSDPGLSHITHAMSDWGERESDGQRAPGMGEAEGGAEVAEDGAESGAKGTKSQTVQHYP